MSLPNRPRSIVALLTALGLTGLAACAPAPPLSDVEAKVFARGCVFSSCHAANGSPAGGLSLSGSTFDKLVNVKSTLAPQKPRVVPFDPEQSFLFEKIAQDKPSAGMRMPPGQPLAEDEIAMIRAWIVAGAENK